MKKAVAGGFWVFVPATEAEMDEIKATCRDTVTVELDDGRCVTQAQRRKAYVLLSAISSHIGYTPLEVVKETTKLMFSADGHTVKWELFSLSDCDRTTARLYITWLIDFCLVMGIPCGEPLYKLCEDMPRYIYACLMNRKCCVCGRDSELHHWDAVGMGRDRDEIVHIGMRAMPLCRKHHTEIHAIGRETFAKRYMVEPMEIDERIAMEYGLKGARKNEGYSQDT